MNRVVLMMCFAHICLNAFAQNVSTLPRGSYQTLIYKITDEEAATIYQHGKEPDVSFFHTLFDRHAADSALRNRLPVGHYLSVRANEATFQCEVISVDNLTIKIINNHRDLLIALVDTLGHEVKAADVMLNKQRIWWSEELNVYRREKTNRQGFLQVRFDGHTSFLTVNRRYNNSAYKRVRYRILGTFPINHLISPVVYLVRNVRSLASRYPHLSKPGILYRVQKLFRAKSYTGFIVFTKPRYRPDDTLKLKATVTDMKGHLLRKKLTLQIDGRNIKTIVPYRPGHYAYSLALTDSLRLHLDRGYNVTLEDRHERDIVWGGFRFEMYELKDNTYSISADNAMISEVPTIHLKGTDSNDLPLFDVTAHIVVISNTVTMLHEKTLFVPDTLWQFTMKMDPLADNHFTLPDSIFPCARTDYKVSVAFTNAEQERMVRDLTLTYDPMGHEVQTKVESDSILFYSNFSGERVRFVAETEQHHVAFERTVTLPYRQKIDPELARYAIYSNDQLLTAKSVADIDPGIQLQAMRTVDSLNIQVANQHQLHFRYQVFKNNHLITEGNATSMNMRRRASKTDMYYVTLFYLWGGEVKELNYDLPFSRKSLHVDIDHPASIFPGETVDVKIRVKDAFNKPVSNADVTAYAITKKFHDDGLPSIINRERFPSRKVFNEFTSSKLAKEINDHLAYDFWKERLGLDSMQFYKFLYPTYRGAYFYIPAVDSVTQIAPFVFRDGYLQEIFYVAIDGQPCFYDGVSNNEPYSFKTTPGDHTLAIRLRDTLVTINSIPVCEGQKLILSVDMRHLPTYVTKQRMGLKFTPQEVSKLWPRFMVLSRRAYDQSRAYVRQGADYHLLNTSTGQDELVGPFYYGKVEFGTPEYSLTFDYAADRSHTFEHNLVDRLRIDMQDRFIKRWLWGGFSTLRLRDSVITERMIRQRWSLPSAKPAPSHNYRKMPSYHAAVGNRCGQLVTLINTNNSVFAMFLINLDQPDEFYIYPGTMAEFSPLRPGRYQASVIFNDQHYVRFDPVDIRPYGRTYLSFTDERVLPPDKFSREVIEKMYTWANENAYVEQGREQELQEIRTLYYENNQNWVDFGTGHTVEGFVKDESGEPVPGVNVIVKGTTNGTATDANGYYRLSVPDGGTLVITFIGYSTQEIKTGGKSSVDVNLIPDVTALQEVVVVGYGVERRSMLTASVATVNSEPWGLMGKVAGVNINGAPGAADSVAIRIRGISTFDASNSPLVLIDGVLMRLDDINPGAIKSIETMKGPAAVALYGSRAANGIIIISTKSVLTTQELRKVKIPSNPMTASLDDEMAGSSLRTHFRDDAFWQPKLITDENGEASFKTTYPDDITGWTIKAVVTASHARQATALTTAQSFKPVTAKLKLPAFLVAGDEATAIGKINNYTPDSLHLHRTLKINNKNGLDGMLTFKDLSVDSIALHAEDNDTLHVNYTIDYKRYRDGEERLIPIYPQGTLESVGTFVGMPHDTTMTIVLDSSQMTHIQIDADLLDVLLDEAHEVSIYPYECSEQLASKLNAMLNWKDIAIYKGITFNDDKKIRLIIRKLQERQNKDGGWGWWQGMQSSSWITLHVLEALHAAKRHGYNVMPDDNNLNNYISKLITFTDTETQLKTWIHLTQLYGKVMAREVVDSLTHKRKLTSTYLKLLAQRLLQLNKIEPDWSWILQLKQETLKGNWYWGEERHTMCDNDIDNTLLVYTMMEAANPEDKRLEKLRSYFIEKRSRHWLNTYVSSRIISTLAPSLLRKNEHHTKMSVTLNGMVNTAVENFPYAYQGQGTSVTIRKNGDGTLYAAVYTQFWNKQPKPATNNFKVTTTWANGEPVLVAGKPATLRVTVRVEKDADYVMLSVPIPAGCTYESKDRGWQNESYREYDLHEARIYCDHLRAGTYTYDIKLVPRYKGSYTLNPAKAEWMYFPVIYGRDVMKKVEIR